MKKVILSFCIIVLISKANDMRGQNLVPNPSFEEINHCPTFLIEIEACKYWMNFGNSPDYFNTCATGILKPPYCGFGYQYPHTGNAMAGLSTYAWHGSPVWPNYREYLGIQLSESLKKGQKYFLSFYINCGEAAPGWQIIATNKIGLRLSTLRFDSCCPPPLNNWSHIYTDSIISDTLNWMRISGSIIADSSYKYLSIGNFFDDNQTDTLLFGGDPFGGSASYYFIDDVCVTTDSIFNENWTSIYKTKIQKNQVIIYPNPIYNDLNIKSTYPIKLIQIFNMFGQEVYKSENFNDRNINLSLSYLISGYYLLRVKTHGDDSDFLINKINNH